MPSDPPKRVCFCTLTFCTLRSIVYVALPVPEQLPYSNYATGPPGANHGPFTVKSSATMVHVHSTLQMTSPTSPCPTISADTEFCVPEHRGHLFYAL